MKLLNIGNSFVNPERIDAIVCENIGVFTYVIFIYVGAAKIKTREFDVPREDIDKIEEIKSEAMQAVYEYIVKFGE